MGKLGNSWCTALHSAAYFIPLFIWSVCFGCRERTELELEQDVKYKAKALIHRYSLDLFLFFIYKICIPSQDIIK